MQAALQGVRYQRLRNNLDNRRPQRLTWTRTGTATPSCRTRKRAVHVYSPRVAAAAIHRVSKKLRKLTFCQNFVKFRPIVKILGHKDSKEDELF